MLVRTRNLCCTDVGSWRICRDNHCPAPEVLRARELGPVDSPDLDWFVVVYSLAGRLPRRHRELKVVDYRAIVVCRRANLAGEIVCPGVYRIGHELRRTTRYRHRCRAEFPNRIHGPNFPSFFAWYPRPNALDHQVAMDVRRRFPLELVRGFSRRAPREKCQW
jgi:hypothetical protein